MDKLTSGGGHGELGSVGGQHHVGEFRTSAAWILWTLIRRLPHADAPGLMQTRTITSLANFSRLADRTGQLPNLKSYCESLTDLLQTRWPDAAAETYPALGGPRWMPRR